MLTAGGSEIPAENRLYLIGMGANLPSGQGRPLDTLVAALAALEARNVEVLARSPWFESEPVPDKSHPWFINGAIYVTALESAYNLLKILHDVEIEFGRVRSVPNAPRPLDLDLLAQIDAPPLTPPETGSAVPDLSGKALMLPHPRLHERAFVLKPLLAIAPDWVHPRMGRSVVQMAADQPDEPVVRLLQG